MLHNVKALVHVYMTCSQSGFCLLPLSCPYLSSPMEEFEPMTLLWPDAMSCHVMSCRQSFSSHSNIIRMTSGECVLLIGQINYLANESSSPNTSNQSVIYL